MIIPRVAVYQNVLVFGTFTAEKRARQMRSRTACGIQETQPTFFCDGKTGHDASRFWGPMPRWDQAPLETLIILRFHGKRWNIPMVSGEDETPSANPWTPSAEVEQGDLAAVCAVRKSGTPPEDR